MLKQIKERHQEDKLIDWVQPRAEQAHQDRAYLLELVEDIKNLIYFNMGNIEDSKMYDEFETMLKRLEQGKEEGLK